MFLLWCIIYSSGVSLKFILCMLQKDFNMSLFALGNSALEHSINNLMRVGGEVGWAKAWNKPKPEKQKIFHFSSRNADFRVCFVIMESSSLEKWNNLPEFFSFRAHGMWSTSDEEINHNVYICAGFECWRSQTNYGWQNKGSPIVNRTFRSEGNSFLKHSSESSSTLNGQQCLISALNFAEKISFSILSMSSSLVKRGMDGRKERRR